MSNPFRFLTYSRRNAFCVCENVLNSRETVVKGTPTFPVCQDRFGSWNDGRSPLSLSCSPPGDHARFFDGDEFLDVGVRGFSTGTLTIFGPLRVCRVVASKTRLFVVAGPDFPNLPMT